MSINLIKSKHFLLCRIAPGLSILLFLIWAFFYSLTACINTPTFHLDGAFQTASGLFRLDSGQAPGRDFYPYLGIGPLISLYPAFKLLGSDLAASVFSAQFMTLILGWMSVSVIYHMVFRPKSLASSFAAGAIIFSAPILISNYYAISNPFDFATAPGNSLRPIRAAVPYLVAIIGYILITEAKSGYIRNLAAGLMTGAVMLWSNDFAIPTAVFFSAYFGGYLYLVDRRNWRSGFFTYLCTAFFSWAILLTFATVGHPVPLLKYNFIDVARDQWWYFGPYGEKARIFNIGQVSRLISPENSFPLTVLVVALIAAFRTKTVEDTLIVWVGVVLFAGGTLASLGGHLGGYYGGFYLWGLITAILVSVRFVLTTIFKVADTECTGSKYRDYILASTMVTILLVGSLFAWSNYDRLLNGAKKDADRFFVNELGGYLGSEWKGYINFARQNSEKKIIEEYWGLWSSLNRSFSTWPVDSVIHALGYVRDVAKASQNDADLIITSRYDTLHDWQPWNLSQNYWFYDELLSGWRQERVSPTTIIWRRDVSKKSFSKTLCEISNDKTNFIIKTNTDGFYEVSLSFNLSAQGRYLLMVRNNVSYAADANGYVSVDPQASNAIFPVLITNNTGNIFDTKIVGNERAVFKIESCNALRIEYINQEVLNIPGLEDFYLTDGNWNRGVAKAWAGFFIPNRENYSNQYAVGKFVKFKNGEFRKITALKPSGRYLNVTVEGTVLDPEVVGIPSQYRIVE